MALDVIEDPIEVLLQMYVDVRFTMSTKPHKLFHVLWSCTSPPNDVAESVLKRYTVHDERAFPRVAEFDSTQKPF